jgi:hypothetical protein
MDSKLTRIVDAAREALRSDSDGWLYQEARWSVYDALGTKWCPDDDILFVPTGATTAGYRRRVHLAVQIVRYVLPKWEETFPGDTTPHDGLRTAESTAAGHLSRGDANSAYQSVWRDADDAMEEGSLSGDNTHPALYRVHVGFAAAKAILVAIGDETFLAGREVGEIHGYVDEWEVALHAAIAYSGGVPSSVQAAYDSALGRAFWEWWLTHAVPDAWRSVPEYGQGG